MELFDKLLARDTIPARIASTVEKRNEIWCYRTLQTVVDFNPAIHTIDEFSRCYSFIFLRKMYLGIVLHRFKNERALCELK